MTAKRALSEHRRAAHKIRRALFVVARRALTSQIKIERGCADCGFREHPAALEFDHLPGTAKSFNIGRSTAATPSMEQFLAEVAKCDVVCANCHRIRTFNRRAVGASA